jgi:predicted RND superfamily exporter protein
MAFFYKKDYAFGTSESISVVVLIGFSVDYILHFSAEYMHSKEDTRDLKMRQSYRQMGVSILSGYLTTLGSGIFLLATDLVFFYKFGETICLAVSYSFIIAAFVYPSFMKVMGPEGMFADITCCFRKNGCP